MSAGTFLGANHSEQSELVSALASRALSRLGTTPESIEPISEGSSANVWKVGTPKGCYALRICRHPDREIEPQVDHALRKALKAVGGAVIEPVAFSEADAAMAQDSDWVLEPFLIGRHPARRALASETCFDLGRTLAALHTLPAEGFGRLRRFENGQFHGGRSGPRDGANDRFDMPLPSVGSEFDEHRLVASLPEYREAIAARLAAVAARLSEARRVVCHTDLHERQLIVRDDDSLAALIDFGGAAVLDPYWDFGSLRYFHGPSCIQPVLDGYMSAGALPETSHHIDRHLIDSFSLCIALHHSTRSRLPGKEHRLDAATRHAASILAGTS